MKLILRFGFYSTEELTTILLHRSKALGWEVYEDLIRKSLRGQEECPGSTPVARRMLALLPQSRRRHDHAAHFQRACQLEQIDDLGLGPPSKSTLQF